MIKIISVSESPEFMTLAIEYFQKIWASKDSMNVYHDSISHTGAGLYSLPQWYLLMKDEVIIGCAGLITNDFISRMDLFPWLCAVYIELEHRGNNYAKLLIEKAKSDVKDAGLDALYLSTDHIGYYEKFGFTYIGDGYHPWGENSRIYRISID